MTFRENIPLAKLTTFKLGGEVRGVASCGSIEDVKAALALSRERGLPWYVIGGGSNILASDKGFEGILIHITADEIHFDDSSDDTVLVTADAGAVWDEVVQEAVTRSLWGLENLAGIPGSAGGAPIQNIGAYGADVSNTLVWVEAFDTTTDTVRRFTHDECAFDYRDSLFKHTPSLIILRSAFKLSRAGAPQLDYTDLKKKVEAGAKLNTPLAIAETVRTIRAGKFPDLKVTGTAGSFFKNPTISNEAFVELQTHFPELPHYPAENGVKISLAWILDHALNLRGFAQGHVRLFENQPLVIVAEQGATAHDVDQLALEVEKKVFDATGITLEREVRML